MLTLRKSHQTCCIDKDSATELGTALNTMYQWYADSKLCIAYLQDVSDEEQGKPFEKSEWFRRGWTLQELIAPQKMDFYDRDWRRIGSKANLVEKLYRSTGIEPSVLTGEKSPSQYSIAQRMSGAAGRITERIEDRAYSLLGLFNVSMPMVYGQREQAFIRLQEAIAAQSADQSIFAWSLDRVNHPEGYSGLFAPSPDSFAQCGDVGKGSERTGFQVTNIGLSITLPTWPYAMETYMAFLDVTPLAGRHTTLTILVARLPGAKQWARIMDHEGRSVLRVNWAQVDEPHGKWTVRELHIRQTPLSQPLYFGRIYGIRLRRLEPLRRGRRTRILSRANRTAEDIVCLAPGQTGTAGVAHSDLHDERRTLPHWAQIRWIKVGFDDDFNPVLMLAKERSDAISANASRDFAKACKNEPKANRRIFDNRWLTSSSLWKRQQVPTCENGWSKGYHIFQPDKLPMCFMTKEYADLEDLNIRIRFSLLPVPVEQSGSEGLKDMFVWTLDIIEHGEPPSWLAYVGSHAYRYGRSAIGLIKTADRSSE